MPVLMRLYTIVYLISHDFQLVLFLSIGGRHMQSRLGGTWHLRAGARPDTKTSASFQQRARAREREREPEREREREPERERERERRRKSP